MKLRSYLKYKDSEVAWLGDVPEHWEVKRAGLSYFIQLGKMLQPASSSIDDEQYEYLKALHVQWETVNVDDLPTMWASKSDLIKYAVKKGDLLVCEGGEVGRAAILSEELTNVIIQNSLHRVRSPHNVASFLMYELEHAASQKWFDILCNKATIAHFTVDKFSALKVALPPQVEQHSITSFLDRETGKIDDLILKKEQLIERLKEKRTALISRAVTKGLNPSVRLKPSGVEWLGDVPEHWEIRKLKSLGFFKAGAGFPDDEQGVEDEELPFFKVADMNLAGNEKYMINSTNTVSRETAKKLGAYTFQKETVIFAKVGAALLLNKRRIITKPSCIDNNTMGYVINKAYEEFIYYWLMTIDLGRLANPGAVPSINDGQLREITIAVPSTTEQKSIAEYLDLETGKIDDLTRKVSEAIEKLKEYRASLISSAVTGKIDVRGS